MHRTLFEQAHEDFRLRLRLLVCDFLAREVLPVREGWRRAALGKLGIIGTAIPEEYGGDGQDDYRFNVVIQEECASAGVTLGGLRTHLDVVVPYFTGLANAEQRARWFPGLASASCTRPSR